MNFIFRCQVAHYYRIYPWLNTYPVGHFRIGKRGGLTISCFVYFMLSHLALYASWLLPMSLGPKHLKTLSDELKFTSFINLARELFNNLRFTLAFWRIKYGKTIHIMSPTVGPISLIVSKNHLQWSKNWFGCFLNSRAHFRPI